MRQSCNLTPIHLQEQHWVQESQCTCARIGWTTLNLSIEVSWHSSRLKQTGSWLVCWHASGSCLSLWVLSAGASGMCVNFRRPKSPEVRYWGQPRSKMVFDVKRRSRQSNHKKNLWIKWKESNQKRRLYWKWRSRTKKNTPFIYSKRKESNEKETFDFRPNEKRKTLISEEGVEWRKFKMLKLNVKGKTLI